MAHHAHAPASTTGAASVVLLLCGAAALALPFLFPVERVALRNSDLVVGGILVAIAAHCLHSSARGAPGRSFGAAIAAMLLSGWLAASPLFLRVPPGPSLMGAALVGGLAFFASLHIATAGVWWSDGPSEGLGT